MGPRLVEDIEELLPSAPLPVAFCEPRDGFAFQMPPTLRVNSLQHPLPLPIDTLDVRGIRELFVEILEIGVGRHRVSNTVSQLIEPG